MREYIICTDSSCDIDAKTLKDMGIIRIEMSVRFENEESDFPLTEVPVSKFYEKMKNGEVAKTSAINPLTFEDAFESILKSGKDILYLCFASKLSTTYNNALIAKEELCKKYPENLIEIVNTACASIGLGYLVLLTNKKKIEGMPLIEAKEYAENISGKICHWFSVDDLNYLKRGGRISAATAFVGNALGIKPIIRLDDEGGLDNSDKARGKSGIMTTLHKKYEDLALQKDGTIIVGHADCPENAEMLKNSLEDTFGCKTEMICDMGPIICAHTGPGTLSLVFLGKNR